MVDFVVYWGIWVSWWCTWYILPLSNLSCIAYSQVDLTCHAEKMLSHWMNHVALSICWSWLGVASTYFILNWPPPPIFSSWNIFIMCKWGREVYMWCWFYCTLDSKSYGIQNWLIHLEFSARRWQQGKQERKHEFSATFVLINLEAWPGLTPS